MDGARKVGYEKLPPDSPRDMGADPDPALPAYLLEHTPVGICVIQDDKIVLANFRLAKMAGFQQPQDLIGLPYRDFIHPDDLELVHERTRLRQAGQDPSEHFELRLRRADGSQFWCEIWPVIIELPSGSMFFVTMLDIDWRKSAERSQRHFFQKLEDRVRTATEHLRGANQQLRLEIRERELAQEQLRSERDRAQLYLDLAQVTLVALDRQGRVTLINNQGARLLGLSEEEILGVPWFETFVAEHRREEQYQAFADILKGERESTAYVETPMVVAGGDKRLVAWNYVLLKDQQGRATGLLGSGEDISDSRRARLDLEKARNDLEDRVAERTAELAAANRELQDREEKFRTIFEQVPAGICHASLGGRFLMVNHRLCEIWGYSPEELTGMRITDIIHPEDLDTTLKLSRSMLSGEQGPYTLHKRYRRKNGSWYWGRATVSLIRDSEENPKYFIAVIENSDQLHIAGHPSEGMASWAWLMDQAPFSLMVYDKTGVMVRSNAAFARMWQVDDVSQLIGQFNILKDHQAKKYGLAEAVRKALNGQTVDIPEAVFDPARSNRPGRKRIARCRAFPLTDAQGEVLGAVLTQEDITEQKDLEQQQQMVTKVFENSAEGIIIADRGGVVQMVNPAFSAITGYDAEEVVGQRLDLLRGEEHSHEFLEEIWRALSTEGQWAGEYWNRRKNGEAYPEWLTLSVFKDTDQNISNYVAVFHDITAIKEGQEAIHFQAYHDALTGLPNRLLLKDRLDQALNQARRNQGLLGVIFLDLDGFKQVNDTLGHLVGDALLKHVAEVLQRNVRESDTVARLGGDEFVAIISGVDSPIRVTQVARRLGQYLNEPLEIDGSPVQISASMGISIFPQDGTDPETLLNNADKAMYRAKEQSRGRYRLFADVLQSEADSRLALETVLRTGLREDSFSIQYIPRVDLASGQVVAVEVCLRWPDMQGCPVGEADFVAVAEESGLIVPLGKMALTKSCRECRDWRDRLKPGPRISLQLCAQQLANKFLAEQISHTLAESGVPAEALDLEVSESYLAVNPEKAAGALEQLADLGVHLTVRDFGVGQASLYQLKFLPVNFIKMGGLLLEDLPGDEAREAIVSAIIAMGHSLGLKVVAEGVENKEQLEFLRTQGCDLAQGSLFGGFVTAGELIDALTTQGRLNPTNH